MWLRPRGSPCQNELPSLPEAGAALLPPLGDTPRDQDPPLELCPCWSLVVSPCHRSGQALPSRCCRGRGRWAWLPLWHSPGGGRGGDLGQERD